MTIRLRDFRPDDLDAVHALNQGAQPAVGGETPEGMRALAGMAACFRVAEDDDGRVAGFLIALTPEAPYASLNFRWFRDRYPAFVYVDRIVVRDDVRGTGLGRRFYDDLAVFARGRAPMITCEVNTRPRNDASLAFHDRLGFEAVGEREAGDDGKAVVMLLKRLPGADRAGGPGHAGA